MTKKEIWNRMDLTNGIIRDKQKEIDNYRISLEYTILDSEEVLNDNALNTAIHWLELAKAKFDKLTADVSAYLSTKEAPDKACSREVVSTCLDVENGVEKIVLPI